jgi:BolA family transcriptional regulator, general stress-responsive regulator
MKVSNTALPLPPEELRALLLAAFAGSVVEVRDDTHLHADHNTDVNHHGGHYKVRIIWAGFAELSRLAAHRAVQKVVAEAWGQGRIHALTLQLLTSEQALLRR